MATTSNINQKSMDDDPLSAEASSANAGSVASAAAESMPPPVENPPAEAPEKNEGDPRSTNETGSNQDSNAAMPQEEGGTMKTDSPPPNHPYMSRVVERSKLLPNTGQYYPLRGTIVDYHESDGRIPPRYDVRYHHEAQLDPMLAVMRAAPATSSSTSTVFLQDEWVDQDIVDFDEAVVNAVNPVAIYNRYTTTVNRLKTQSDGLKLALSNVSERYATTVEYEFNDSKQILSTLVLMAALEESLQVALQRQQEFQQQGQTEEEPGAGTAAAKKGLNDPPRYYTTNPSIYLQDPAKNGEIDGQNKNTNQQTYPKAQMTPAILAQRVRQGCQWAWTYLQAQQEPLQLLSPPIVENGGGSSAAAAAATVAAAATFFPEERRRSSRAVVFNNKEVEEPSVVVSRTTTATRSAHRAQPEPTPVHRGGRVALWWLQTLQNGGLPLESEYADVEGEKPEEIGDGDAVQSAEKGTDQSKVSPNESIREEIQASESYDVMEEDEEEAKDEDDDDEDYNAEDDEHNDEDVLEDVEKERGKLSPVPFVRRKSRADSLVEDVGEDVDMEEEEENNEEHEIMYENPYLRPSFSALLESLAHSKAISLEAIQSAMAGVTMRIKHNKRFSEFGLSPSTLALCDQVALAMENPDYPSDGTLVLKCVSGEGFGELQRLEASNFGRCKFELDVIGEMEAAVQEQRREEQLKREAEYKNQKSWDKWRFRGIQEGFCVWPEWKDAAEEWVKNNTEAQASTEEQPQENEGADVTRSDKDLAKSLEEIDGAEVGGRRRKTRRAAASATDGVFYGNQSQLTQKQLFDALLRLIKASTCQTLVNLQSTVGDDSNDPIRRCRISLGKMIWKRNMAVRKAVTAAISDHEVVRTLESGKGLLSIASEDDSVSGTQDAALTAEEAEDLLSYIQELHVTEINLREMVLKQIGAVPIPIISCAADERLGSMENMDRGDFDDSSNIEWNESGHGLIGKLIYRPPNEWTLATDVTSCNWYSIQAYSESIETDADDAEEDAVERRMRFRAVAAAGPGEDWVHEGEMLLLTEAQVHAGVAAAKMQRKMDQPSDQAAGHLYASSSKKNEEVTLVPIDSGEGDNSLAHDGDIHGRIVGHDTILDPEDPAVLQDRILILPDSAKGANNKPAFWAVLDTRADDGSPICRPFDQSIIYSIENSSYGPESEAHRTCHDILEWLRGNPKIGPFLDPVDPVALGIPTYFEIIKHPMDMSTISDKLEKGAYSNFTPAQSRGKRFPVSLMLNGPFRDDVELMFDNAAGFNPPDDWIHQAAKTLKQSFLRKIRDVTVKAETKGGRNGRVSNMYVDEDSDFDMNDYDDDDDDFTGGRKGRKRKKGSRAVGTIKDEPAAKAIEHPIRLQNSLRGGQDLRGPFARLPVNTDVNSFSIRNKWTCQRATSPFQHAEDDRDNKAALTSLVKEQQAKEMDELMSLQHAIYEDETARLRRSTRAGPLDRGGKSLKTCSERLEFMLRDKKGSLVEVEPLPASRMDVEILAEKLHEETYSVLYRRHEKELLSNGGYGTYSPGSFPPYLGRAFPTRGEREGTWEIRAPFVVPALRWVLRGLIQSGHLTALEPMTTNDYNSGVIITNDVYYYDARLCAYEVLDARERMRSKRSGTGVDDESEEEIELSEYEKLRAERVARNAERLRMLGLA